jgi:hypothetical protein
MSATGTGVYLVHAFFMIDLLMIDRKHFVPFVLFFSSLFTFCGLFQIPYNALYLPAGVLALRFTCIFCARLYES